MTARYKFFGTEHVEAAIHFPGTESDYTLCGLTMDRDPETGGDFELTKEKVNCKACINIVNFCKKIKPTEMSGT